MPSTRFTIALRAKLVRTITSFSFEKLEKENENRSAELAEELYNSWVSAEQQNAMKSLPASFFRQITGSVTVRTQTGYTVNLKFSEVKNYIPDNFPSSSWGNGTSIAKFPELSSKVEDLAVAEKKTKEEKTAFTRKTESYLNQFTTIEKFIEAAPELYAICKDDITNYCGRSVTTAVAPVVNELLCTIAKNRNEFRSGCV